MEKVIEISILELMTAYVFIVILFFILKLRGINREKQLIISTIRMTVQLVLVGYILGYIFEIKSLLLTFLIILIMATFAVFNIFNRVPEEIPRELKKIIALAMFPGTLLPLFYFMFVVIKPNPWYTPQYIIPIAGMIIGNSMTGITLGVHSLLEGFKSRADSVEAALMLGATPKMASQDIVNNAFDSAILPSLNSLVGMGIVFLPGMMTGQILAGLSPLTAISYQIAILLGIVGGVSFTMIILIQLGYKAFFNEYSQLKS